MPNAQFRLSEVIQGGRGTQPRGDKKREPRSGTGRNIPRWMERFAEARCGLMQNFTAMVRRDFHQLAPKGNRTVNVVPFPISLTTSMVPRWATTMAWQIESPSPLPPCERPRDLSTREKRSKGQG